MPGSKFCPLCGGINVETLEEKANRNNYRIAKWKTRLLEFSDNEHISSLREEVGLLRIMIEERMNICKDSTDLMFQSQSISDLIMKVEKVVTSCQRLENTLKTTLNKQGAIQLAQEFITIISNNINDPETIEQISNELLLIISRGSEDSFKERQ